MKHSISIYLHGYVEESQKTMHLPAKYGTFAAVSKL